MPQAVRSQQKELSTGEPLTWDFLRPQWDFLSGKALGESEPLDPLDLTLLHGTVAALSLVYVVAAGGRPQHHAEEGALDLADTFALYASEVKAGRAAEEVATVYVPRNHTRRRKQVIAAMLATAADAPDSDEARGEALRRLCHHSGIRSLDRGDVVPLPTDRRTTLQRRWRETLLDGAWLLGLRGAGRCLACERKLAADQLGGRTVRRKVASDQLGGRRVDYCTACTAGRRSGSGHLRPSLAEAIRPTHNEWIRTVLDSAEPVFLPFRFS